MPPYRLLWLEIAERQYLDLPADVLDLVDARLAQLGQDPLSLPDAAYDPASDQWSHGIWLPHPSRIGTRTPRCRATATASS